MPNQAVTLVLDDDTQIVVRAYEGVLTITPQYGDPGAVEAEDDSPWATLEEMPALTKEQALRLGQVLVAWAQS